MSLRIIVQTDDASMAANVGGNVLTTLRTYDIEAPELEMLLSAELGQYTHRQVIGVEVVKK